MQTCRCSSDSPVTLSPVKYGSLHIVQNTVLMVIRRRNVPAVYWITHRGSKRPMHGKLKTFFIAKLGLLKSCPGQSGKRRTSVRRFLLRRFGEQSAQRMQTKCIRYHAISSELGSLSTKGSNCCGTLMMKLPCHGLETNALVQDEF